MGITIHYSGRFNPAASLSKMIEEVKELLVFINGRIIYLKLLFRREVLKTQNILMSCMA